jgi:hypothetical protein
MMEVYKATTDCNGITFQYDVPGFDRVGQPYILYAPDLTPKPTPQVNVAAPEVRPEDCTVQ